jgi:cytochrome P450
MSDKTPNHFLTDMKCPVNLEDVDLFAPGAQEHWYDAYPILHGQSPVHKLAGEGLTPDTDAFILSKHEDISMVVKDPDRFPPIQSSAISEMAASGVNVEEVPNLNAMQASMVTLRRNRQTPGLVRVQVVMRR